MYGRFCRSQATRLETRTVCRICYAASFTREFNRLGKLNDMPVEEINTAALLEVFQPLRAKYKSAHVTLAKVERVLDFAAMQGLRAPDNPARWKGHFSQLVSKAPAPDNYKALPYADIPQLIARLRDESLYCHDNADRYRRKLQGSLIRRHTSISARAVEFLILTATRQQEAIAATWDERRGFVDRTRGAHEGRAHPYGPTFPAGGCPFKAERGSFQMSFRKRRWRTLSEARRASLIGGMLASKNAGF
jgi:integrase